MEFVLLPFVLGPMVAANPIGWVILLGIFIFCQILGEIFPALRGE